MAAEGRSLPDQGARVVRFPVVASPYERACPATTEGPFIGSDGTTLHCGDIEGHDGAHFFHIEWGDTIRPRWVDSMPSRCEHRDDPTYNGRWCAICNPEFGGDRGAGI